MEEHFCQETRLKCLLYSYIVSPVFNFLVQRNVIFPQILSCLISEAMLDTPQIDSKTISLINSEMQ